MIALQVDEQHLESEIGCFIATCRTPEFRTMQQFAIDEIILPLGGPRPGPYDIEAQPFARLWFELVDSGEYCRFVAIGPTQTGKTLSCFVIPAIYYLFERGENVGVGIPQMEMASDKWERDFLPIIKASRYADLLPESGKGSRGGRFESITFRNGATLKFLSGNGGDEKRSGVTFRVLVITEADKFDTSSTTSREGDPITQMIARLDAFATLNSVVFMECTVSVETGRIWVEYQNGTASRIALLCPYCQGRVTPEREHLVGHLECDNEIDARDRSHFVCPACNHPWTEDDRAKANADAVVVHKGQEVTSEGMITGPKPKTLTAAFRWTSVNNLLRPAADFGGKEFKARTDPNEENSEKSIIQFVWAMPWRGEMTGVGINPEIVASRLTGLDRGLVPEDVETLVVQIDVHLRWHYWTILATSPNRVRSIIDYGLSWNPERTLIGPEAAIRQGLYDLADELENRTYVTDEGRIVKLDLCLVDGGYHQEIGVEFVTERGAGWRLIKGQGRPDKRENRIYHQPDKKNTDTRPGDHWCDRRQPACDEAGNERWWMLFADCDYWMHQVHSAFMSTTFLEDGKTRRPGSVALFGKDPMVHLRQIDSQIVRSSIAAQMCGWVWRASASKTRGEQIGWESQWSQDHWLDTTYGSFVGDSIVRAYHPRFKRPVSTGVPGATDEESRFQMPDGRPYFLTERT